MIYYLSQQLQQSYHFFNVFHYVSVRAICALISSLAFAFILGNRFIAISQKNFRSKVREETPKRHQEKNDTPTMGGLFILIIFTINTLLWNNLSKSEVWIFLITLLIFGIIGFIDDYSKIYKQKGLSAKTKFNAQIILGSTIMLAWYFISQPTTTLCIPFFKNIIWDMGWLIIPWGALIIISTSNAVNLTDGLDGLAAGPLMINFSTFAVISYLAGHKEFSRYLFIPYANSAELTISAAILIGTLLSFLWYNTYPAQIFMGDVGSLALGAGLGLMAIMTRNELLLPIAGGIFFMETISVIAQVFSFKMWRRRIFKMAPIHHHFELLGWTEPKITVRFWIISLILSLLTLLTLKLR